MRRQIILQVVLLLSALFPISYPRVSDAESEARAGADVGHPYGVVTGLIGQATGAMAGGFRQLQVGDRVAVGEEIHVGPAGTLEILWGRRALFSLEERTKIAVQESKNGPALLQVLEGMVRTAYSYNEGHPTDTLTVRIPAAHAILRGGIIEATVPRTERTESPTQTAKFTNAAASGGGLFRMIEGQAQIEPHDVGTKPFLLKAGYEFHATPKGDAVRPSGENRLRKLTAVQSHHEVPGSAVQHVVRIHVEHALEVERALSRPSRDGNDAEKLHRGQTGAIVSTSLGIPLAAFSSPSGTTSLPPVLAPALPPGPVVGGGTGPAALAPSAPIVQMPSVTVLTPSQSGGINTRSLLRDVIQDLGGNNGQGRGRGRRER